MRASIPLNGVPPSPYPRRCAATVRATYDRPDGSACVGVSTILVSASGSGSTGPDSQRVPYTSGSHSSRPSGQWNACRTAWAAARPGGSWR